MLKTHIARLEERVQRDEGNRGIGNFILPDELFKSASALMEANKIGIVTGFPCLIDFTPPTETDGPLGAVAMAKALINIGKEVVIVTDESSEGPMLACVAGAGLSHELLTLESYPSRIDFDDGDIMRLDELHRWRSVCSVLFSL